VVQVAADRTQQRLAALVATVDRELVEVEEVRVSRRPASLARAVAVATGTS
jgi:hypothetical protein